MALSTYDGSGTMYLVKDTSTGINGVNVENTNKDGKMYSINGMEVTEHVKNGVTIKDGKKYIGK